MKKKKVQQTQMSNRQHLKQQLKQEQITKRQSIPMHGQIANKVTEATINQSNTYTWLTRANLKTETEALITACQDRVIATNYMKAKILRTGIDQNCRVC